MSLNFFAFFFLLFSICSVWLFEKKRFAGIFFAVGVVIAFITSLIDYQGLFITIIFCSANYVYFKRQVEPIGSAAIFTMILVMCFLLASQMLPGFIPWQVVNDEVISANGSPYSLALNIDKVIAGAAILIFGLVPIRRMLHLKQMLNATFPITAIGAVIIATFALLFGVAAMNIKVPEVWITWLAINLLINCVCDEAIFRFFVQGRIYKAIETVPFSAAISIVLSTALFVTYYAPAPTNYLMAVGLGSVVFGYAYHVTQRVEAAILCHFVVNVIHFFFFSYPMLSS